MRIFLVLLSTMFLVACAGGQQYRVENMDGTFYRVNDVGHTNLARKGAQYSVFELCTEDGQCNKVAETTITNPTLIEQLGGPTSNIISADMVRRGLKDSGDTISATAEGGSGGDSTSISGSWSNSTSTATSNSWAKGGCKGKCN